MEIHLNTIKNKRRLTTYSGLGELLGMLFDHRLGSSAASHARANRMRTQDEPSTSIASLRRQMLRQLSHGDICSNTSTFTSQVSALPRMWTSCVKTGVRKAIWLRSLLGFRRRATSSRTSPFVQRITGAWQCERDCTWLHYLSLTTPIQVRR